MWSPSPYFTVSSTRYTAFLGCPYRVAVGRPECRLSSRQVQRHSGCRTAVQLLDPIVIGVGLRGDLDDQQGGSSGNAVAGFVEGCLRCHDQIRDEHAQPGGDSHSQGLIDAPVLGNHRVELPLDPLGDTVVLFAGVGGTVTIPSMISTLQPSGASVSSQRRTPSHSWP
jgi:hypothetical protein